jgi:hypothetical protein
VKASERLLGRLREAGLDIPTDATLVRVHAPRSGRENGAWSWTVADASGTPLIQDSQGRAMAIGSHYPVSTILRLGFDLGSDYFGDICIDPPLSAIREVKGQG